jgi:hypothetical protein
MMFKKILIANRGEIAVYPGRQGVGDFRGGFPHRLACPYGGSGLLPGPLLRTKATKYPRVIQIAKTCGAEAIHPGYGFLQRTQNWLDSANRT